MALANVVTGVQNMIANSGVAEFGSSNFKRTEDQFITGNAGQKGLLQNNPQEVIIACKNKKRRVCGILNEGIKIDGEAKWEELFGGGIAALGGSLVNMVNRGAQYLRGTSFQQPWMNRKFWNSTKPFSFSFSFNFIADENDGKTDVWEPTQALLSFVFPRQLKTGQKLKDAIGDTALFNTQQKNTRGRDGVIAAAADAFVNEFAIPGPAIGYLGDNPQGGEAAGAQGDAVTLVIGNLFAFGGVYLEKVGIEYSPNMGGDGYPLWAKCTVTATVMDVNYCNTDGSFMVNQFADQQGALSTLIDAVTVLVTDMKNDLGNVVKTTKEGLF